MTGGPITVVIVDDQGIVRAGFRSRLTGESHLRVVGEAADGRQGVDTVRRLRPDVTLMDIRMPLLDGISATRELRAAGVTSKILMLTTFDLDEYVFEALRAGASGFILKGAPADDLAAAIRAVASGNSLLAPAVTRRVIDAFVRTGRSPTEPGDPRLAHLTARELEVLGLLGKGLSKLDIGRRLHISAGTTKTHVSNVLTKLDLRDRVHTVIFAYEHNIVAAGGDGSEHLAPNDRTPEAAHESALGRGAYRSGNLTWATSFPAELQNGFVEQRIATTRLTDGSRIAYSVTGRGPFLIHAPGWLTHLELSWAMPPERALYESLAHGRTLVRYDRAGCGMSGATERTPSMELELETLDAVARAVRAPRFDVFGASLGAVVATAWAAAHPAQVERLVLYGGWVRGADIASAPLREHILGLIAEHWGFGSDVLADIFAPDADAATRAAFVRYQREAATPQIARAMLALAYHVDVSDRLANVQAPTLVLHRDQDRAAPLEQGRALAAGIPGAQLEVLLGRDHLPFIGDGHAIAQAIRRFLGLPPLRSVPGASITARQYEVARLVAEGLTNRDIAGRLGISERSAESHVERIRDRLGFRSRSQIAAWIVGGGR